MKGNGLVTLAVQRAEFAKAKANLQQAAKVDLGSRTGLCGQYGQPTLYAPLSHGRLLTVAAPCASPSGSPPARCARSTAERGRSTS